jgi:hypothetical protein
MTLLDGEPVAVGHGFCSQNCHRRVGVLQEILRIHPQGAGERNDTNLFPLALMIQNGRSWDSTMALTIRSFPEAFVWVKNLPKGLIPGFLEKVGRECGPTTVFSLIQARPDLLTNW